MADVPIAPAMPAPCESCPWRKSNHGKRHPGGWFTKKNAERLWAGLRSGEAPGMSCHRTDVNNEVPEGQPAVPEGTATLECAGALLLVQREIRRLDAAGQRYFKLKRRGFTRQGAMYWVWSRGVAAGTMMGAPGMRAIEECEDIAFPWPDLLAEQIDVTLGGS